jgi:ribonuclease-3
LKLNENLILGKGETSTGGSAKPRLLASAFEALLGAMYLDAGYDRTYQLIEKCFTPLIQTLDPDVDYRSDYKSRLQEEVQRIYKEPPVYELEKEEGPPHERVFHVKLIVRKNVLSRGSGRSKRQAEQEAAKQAVEGKLYEKI